MDDGSAAVERSDSGAAVKRKKPEKMLIVPNAVHCFYVCKGDTIRIRSLGDGFIEVYSTRITKNVSEVRARRVR